MCPCWSVEVVTRACSRARPEMSDPLSNVRFVFDGQPPPIPDDGVPIPDRARRRRRRSATSSSSPTSGRPTRASPATSPSAPPRSPLSPGAGASSATAISARSAGPGLDSRLRQPAVLSEVSETLRVRAGVDPRVLGDRGGVTGRRVGPADDEAARHVGRAVRRAASTSARCARWSTCSRPPRPKAVAAIEARVLPVAGPAHRRRSCGSASAGRWPGSTHGRWSNAGAKPPAGRRLPPADRRRHEPADHRPAAVEGRRVRRRDPSVRRPGSARTATGDRSVSSAPRSQPT